MINPEKGLTNELGRFANFLSVKDNGYVSVMLLSLEALGNTDEFFYETFLTLEKISN